MKKFFLQPKVILKEKVFIMYCFMYNTHPHTINSRLEVANNYIYNMSWIANRQCYEFKTQNERVQSDEGFLTSVKISWRFDSL